METQGIGSVERKIGMGSLLLGMAAALLVGTSCTSSRITQSGTSSRKTHEYVDLGLPSKTAWATCNVGAKKAGEYGNFYAWGETMPKSEYSWNTYTLPSETLIRNPVLGDREFTDKRTYYRLTGPYNTETKNLLPEDDAAKINWGEKWSTPTLEQWKELCDTTLCQWTQQKKGFLVTSKKNGKSIFLPACGMYYGKEAPKTFLNEGDSVRYDGCYWAGTISGKGKAENYASYLRFNTGYQRMKLPLITAIPDLYCGMSIRPVTKLQE